MSFKPFLTLTTLSVMMFVLSYTTVWAQFANSNQNYRRVETYNGRPADGDAGSIVTGNIESDLYQQVVKMQEEMRQLRGDVEKNNFEIRGLKRQIKSMQEDVDFRLKSLEPNAMGTDPATGVSPIDSPPPQPEAFTPGRAGNHISVTSAGSGELAKPGVKHADEPRRHYNEAFRLLNQNRYEQAATEFEKFTKLYPDDPLIGNAYYWLGETYYIRKNYVTAADSFRQGYQKLPEGPKAPDNLLKLAMSLKEQDRKQDACVILEQIDKKFKNASTNLLQRAKAEKKLLACK